MFHFWGLRSQVVLNVFLCPKHQLCSIYGVIFLSVVSRLRVSMLVLKVTDCLRPSSGYLFVSAGSTWEYPIFSYSCLQASEVCHALGMELDVISVASRTLQVGQTFSNFVVAPATFSSSPPTPEIIKEQIFFGIWLLCRISTLVFLYC